MEDSFYIKKVKEGKTDYFAFIVKKYQSHVFNVVMKITNNYATAEDITQETFLKFFNSIGMFNEDNPVFPYLLRIAVNCTKDYIKKEKKQAEIKEKISQNKISIENGEKLEKMYELIYKLPENQKEALLLHYRDGNSIKEIAFKMNISLSNAKILLFRGRKALFEMWKKEK